MKDKTLYQSQVNHIMIVYGYSEEKTLKIIEAYKETKTMLDLVGLSIFDMIDILNDFDKYIEYEFKVPEISEKLKKIIQDER